jgi:hypothetical protein
VRCYLSLCFNFSHRTFSQTGAPLTAVLQGYSMVLTGGTIPTGQPNSDMLPFGLTSPPAWPFENGYPQDDFFKNASFVLTSFPNQFTSWKTLKSKTKKTRAFAETDASNSQAIAFNVRVSFYAVDIPHLCIVRQNPDIGSYQNQCPTGYEQTRENTCMPPSYTSAPSSTENSGNLG